MPIRKLLDKKISTVEILKNIFASELPGVYSQVKMAPEIRIKDIFEPNINSDTVESAVLFLIYPSEKQLKTVLIQRPFYNGVHSGQISFPGGKREKGESIVQTALREAKEEIGISEKSVNIIGSLTPLYIPPSNYLVYPFVGYVNNLPSLIPEPFEVSDIYEVDLDFFFDHDNYKTELITLSDGDIVKTPCFVYNRKVIWGATAMIIMEFVDLVDQYFKKTNH